MKGYPRTVKGWKRKWKKQSRFQKAHASNALPPVLPVDSQPALDASTPGSPFALGVLTTPEGYVRWRAFNSSSETSTDK